MPRVEECGFDLSISRTPEIRSGVNIKAGEKELKVRHLYPNNEVATRFNGDRWSYGLNMKTKDFDVEYLRPVRAGKLIIRQKIPNGRWELFPTPEFKLCTTPVVRGSLKDEVDVGYDLLAHRGAVEQRLDFGGKYRLRISAHSPGAPGFPLLAALKPRLVAYPFLFMAATKGSGLDSSLTMNVKGGALGIAYNRALGPVIGFKTESNKRVGVETEVSVVGKEWWTALDCAPLKDCKFKLTAEATVNKSSLSKPFFRLGARYEV